MIIDFESEKLKRSDYQDVFVDLLDDFLDLFLTSEKDEREGLLTNFLEKLDLGPKPLTHFVQSYFNNQEVQCSVDAILLRIPLHGLANVVDFMEACWPQEKNLVKRFKVLLIGFSIKKLKTADYLIDMMADYLLGKSNWLETHIISPVPNVLEFPSRGRQGNLR